VLHTDEVPEIGIIQEQSQHPNRHNVKYTKWRDMRGYSSHDGASNNHETRDNARTNLRLSLVPASTRTTRKFSRRKAKLHLIGTLPVTL
jgi:hypothetical protein